MKEGYEKIIYEALTEIRPNLPEDAKRLTSALRDLSGGYPREMNTVTRSIDERFISICCHSKGMSIEDIAKTVDNASGYLQSEYMMDSGWATYMSNQFVTAIWAYENDCSIGEALKRRGIARAENAQTELIDESTPGAAGASIGAAGMALWPEDASGMSSQSGGVIGSGAASQSGGIIGSGAASQSGGSFGPASGGSRKLAPFIIGGVALMVVVFALSALFFIKGSSDEAEDEPATETTAVAETNESQEPDDAVEAGGAKPIDRVFAHRGTGGSENTFASFDSAIAQGAKYVEQDAVLLSDGEFYVSHDRGLTLDTARAQGNPRLRDVFERYGDTIVYVVELKTWTGTAANALLSLIKEFGYENNVIVQCFDQEQLRVIKSADSSIVTMCLCDFNGRDGDALLAQGCSSQYVDMICVSNDQGLMTEANLNRARNSGKKFGAWLLDTPDQIKSAINMDLDFYFTTQPGTALKLEEEYR